MPKIIILKGLPASGKSTWAKNYIKKDPSTKRVNKDELRGMLDNSKWSKANEKFVLKIRDSIIMEALDNGNNIIVDDTNLHDKHLIRIQELAKLSNFKSTVEVNDSFLEVGVDECVKRDLKRPNSVGEKVIRSMYNSFLKPKKSLKQDGKLPKAAIFDIDGTLAIMGERNPYDWEKVSEDTLNNSVFNLYSFFRESGYKIIICSGRESVCAEATKQWLEDHSIFYDRIYMRSEGDKRKDSVVKKEFAEDIIKSYYVDVVIDDRNQVVEMWRDIGLECWQIAEGDF